MYPLADTKALKERILHTAEREAEETIKRAKREAEEIIERAKKRGEEESREMIKEAEKESREEMKREETMAHLELRKRLLHEKQEEIGRVFSSLHQKIREMKNEEYEALLTKMILSQVEEGTEEVIFSKKDRKTLGPAFIKSLNKELISRGRKGRLTLSKKTRPIGAGFILKITGVENNNSFTEILAIQQDELEAEVAGILFKE